MYNWRHRYIFLWLIWIWFFKYSSNLRSLLQKSHLYDLSLQLFLWHSILLFSKFSSVGEFIWTWFSNLKFDLIWPNSLLCPNYLLRKSFLRNITLRSCQISYQAFPNPRKVSIQSAPFGKIFKYIFNVSWNIGRILVTVTIFCSLCRMYVDLDEMLFMFLYMSPFSYRL